MSNRADMTKFKEPSRRLIESACLFTTLQCDITSSTWINSFPHRDNAVSVAVYIPHLTGLNGLQYYGLNWENCEQT